MMLLTLDCGDLQQNIFASKPLNLMYSNIRSHQLF
jgi:hypothetical protein